MEPGRDPVLWRPSATRQAASGLADYIRSLEDRRGLSFSDYEGLWEWSVNELDSFWESIWDYFEVGDRSEVPYALGSRTMPGAEWFPGARLNYAEQIFRQARADEPAIVYYSEAAGDGELSWDSLEREVAAFAQALRAFGVGPGDRVAAYLPNIPEAVVALLACASLGAIWSSVSPDFGAASAIDRFAQIEPRVLLAVDGYRHRGKEFDRRSEVANLMTGLPSVSQTVIVEHLGGSDIPDGAIAWQEVVNGHQTAELTFNQLPFDHPLWILYSSGTTGLPKAIVHGHGGIVLEHSKSLRLQLDIGVGDRFFWYASTGWMVWNVLVGGLLVGATVVLYDGDPAYPSTGRLWEFAETVGITCFGTSAAYLMSSRKADLSPRTEQDLSRLRSIASTGSPLPDDGFEWVYSHVKEDVWLFSTSGGTDVCTAFVGGSPTLPVRAGEIQCRTLGAAVAAFDDQGRAVIDELGELVVTQPMPCMPLCFWNDPGDARYIETYFEMYPGVWRHGDWIRIGADGSCIIYGRSDATINRHGVRMGTSEFYRVIEALPRVKDSLVVDVPSTDGTSEIIVFVVIDDEDELDEELIGEIRAGIRRGCTPRHLPDLVHRVAGVPRNLTGKKLEIPVSRILMGAPPESVVKADQLSDQEILTHYVDLARERQEQNRD
jgi:acetoacetyl-CoA synthetase